MKKFKKLPESQWEAVKNEIKMTLHASRDCLRNQGTDTTKIRFSVNDPYYGEAFGILRALSVLGYGQVFGAVNTPEDRTNFQWWFHEIQEEVLREENYHGNNQCDHCFERYGNDGVRNRRKL